MSQNEFDWQILGEDEFDQQIKPHDDQPPKGDNRSISTIDNSLLRKFALPAVTALMINGSGGQTMPSNQAVADQLVNGDTPPITENYPHIPVGPVPKATEAFPQPINFKFLNDLLMPNITQEIQLKENQPYFSRVGLGTLPGNLNRSSPYNQTISINRYDEGLNHFDIDPLLISGRINGVVSPFDESAWIEFVTNQGLKVNIHISGNEKVMDYFSKYQGMDDLSFIVMMRELETQITNHPSGEEATDQLVTSENVMSVDMVLNLDSPEQRELMSFTGAFNDFPYFVYSENPFDEANLSDVEIKEPKWESIAAETIEPIVQPDGSTIWELRSSKDGQVVRFHQKAISTQLHNSFQELLGVVHRPKVVNIKFRSETLRPVITQVNNRVVAPLAGNILQGHFGEIDAFPVITEDNAQFILEY